MQQPAINLPVVGPLATLLAGLWMVLQAAPACAQTQNSPPLNAATVTEVPKEVLQALDTTPPSRLVVLEFKVLGDHVPRALVYQLQDGFVLGLVRHGVQVIDHEELRKRLKGNPELVDCDTSPCLKAIGQLLRTRFAVRIEVVVNGNNYKMAARIFRTAGTAPAALPIDTQSRFCDICTVTEARENMLRLADSIRVPDEPDLDDLGPAQTTAQREIAVPSLRTPLFVTALGIATVVVGALVTSDADDHDKAQSTLGGGLLGVGASAALVGLYNAVDTWHAGNAAAAARAARTESPAPGTP